MKPDSDEYYCFQWCGRMRWACVHNMTGRDCKWVLARSLGRIVPGRVEIWGEYQHVDLQLLSLQYSLKRLCRTAVCTKNMAVSMKHLLPFVDVMVRAPNGVPLHFAYNTVVIYAVVYIPYI
jgi:hypothetical protein